MNNHERKIHYYLLGTQGPYYFFLVIPAFSFQLVTDLYLIDKAPRAIYLTSLATAFLLGIGISLFLAKKYYKQSLYGGVLGIIGQRPEKCVSGRKSYSGIFRPLQRPGKITEITFSGYLHTLKL